MKELGLMERFADPATFDTLTFGEKVSGSLVTTLMGMGTTFTILILLWWIIVAMTKIMKTGTTVKPQKQKAAPAIAEASENAVKTAASAPEAVTETNNDIVAVIMAAISAFEGTGYAGNLFIRKINRVSGQQTEWRKAGSADCIESRKF